MTHNSKDPSSNLLKRSCLSGILFGIGFAAFVDEVVFHQLLRWHHFYDQSTPVIGLISDGLFHAFSWFATVGGLFMLADLQRRRAVNWYHWIGFTFVGLGAFQVYDGIIQHKILRIHQIRYVDNLWVYDLIWNAVGVLLVIIGIILIRKSRKKPVDSP